MKTRIVFLLVLVQLSQAHADVTFKQLRENQSLELFCPPQQDHKDLTSLHLYHSRGHAQTTLLSVRQDGGGGGGEELRMDPDYKRRLQVSGGRNTSRVKVTLLGLEAGDSGLYVCEHVYRDNRSQHTFFTAHTLLLSVTSSGRKCQCSSSYPLLITAIFSVTCLLSIVLLWLAVERCVKTRQHPSAPAAAPVYEEMSRKQQHSGIMNKQEVPSHLEEVTSPLYANMKQTHDNAYACPRHIALKA
ncbi:uncharacterized protein LOC133642661 [Entelurus aequoreus]|uniref:uncharacterized protein LOC133642661 n=1 Tax=Entelurus aequoreus TaxID=161455 RepID=UPI002B1D6DEB|nr:uncharacterized protein LOC133642661 [Entelurus aequoreus]